MLYKYFDNVTVKKADSFYNGETGVVIGFDGTYEVKLTRGDKKLFLYAKEMVKNKATKKKVVVK